MLKIIGDTLNLDYSFSLCLCMQDVWNVWLYLFSDGKENNMQKGLAYLFGGTWE